MAHQWRAVSAIYLSFCQCAELFLVPAWKARFGAQCISHVVQGTLTARPPKYSVILELDRKIRDLPLPQYCHDPPPQGAGWSQIMSHYMPITYRHLS